MLTVGDKVRAGENMTAPKLKHGNCSTGVVVDECDGVVHVLWDYALTISTHHHDDLLYTG